MKNNHHHNVTKEELEQGLAGLEQRMDQKFVTKKELEQGLAGLEQRMDQKLDRKLSRFVTKEELAQTEARIVRWVVALFLGSTVLISTLVGAYATLLLTKF